MQNKVSGVLRLKRTSFEHLTKEGLEKIVALKANLNLGLSDVLKAAFPNSIPVPRPTVKNSVNLDPQWLAGFTSGEGSFMVEVGKSSANRRETRGQVRWTFQLAQHSRDEQLFISIIKYFGLAPQGNVYLRREGAYVYVRVRRISDILDKIIPFFAKYPIIGVKAKDFEDWCLIAQLMRDKKHLTRLGFKEILKIKAEMNKGRPLPNFDE